MSAPVDLDSAREIAEAVLFEGYMLYPYRANDPKNRVRWQFGVLAPPAYVTTEPSERAFLQTDLLLEGRDVTVEVRVRFLHVQRRTVEQHRRERFYPVDSLDVGDAVYLPWDEAVTHEVTWPITLPGLGEQAGTFNIDVPASDETELLAGGGRIVGRLVRRREPLRAGLEFWAEALPGPYGVRRLRLRLTNQTELTDASADRTDALRGALVAAHLLVAVHGGAFVSLIAPPEWASRYAGDCEQVGCFPVLAGPPDTRNLMLASPIILYDHPQVAPESTTQFCDATEMDEMLTLRTLTLTDEEKRQARGSDARAAALVDHIDNLPPELMDRLHGAIRSMTAVARPVERADVERAEPGAEPPWWDPIQEAAVDPETDFVVVDETVVTRGSAVRLRPGRRRADAQDMFLDGRSAHVEAVVADVDGRQHLAVTLDELVELGAIGANPHGRFLYFAPDEIEPIRADA
jgi:hypothetical protein